MPNLSNLDDLQRDYQRIQKRIRESISFIESEGYVVTSTQVNRSKMKKPVEPTPPNARINKDGEL